MPWGVELARAGRVFRLKSRSFSGSKVRDSLQNSAPSPLGYVGSGKDTDRLREKRLRSKAKKDEGPLDATGTSVATKDIIGTFGKI